MTDRKQSMALVPASFAELQAMSATWAKSALIASAMRGRPEDVALVVATGMELGLQPLASLRLINIVEGKPALGADALVAIVKSRRDVCEYFVRVEGETNDSQAVYVTKRVGDPEPQRMKFTMQDAQRMGLAGRDNWKKQPATMLRHRARAALAREVYPDIVGAIFTDEEAAEFAREPPRPDPVMRAREANPMNKDIIAPPIIDVEPEPEPPAIDEAAWTRRIDELKTQADLDTVRGPLNQLPKSDAKVRLRDRYLARVAEVCRPLLTTPDGP